MNIENSFLENKIVDGFPVPSYIRSALAVQIKILEIVDEICKKHNIAYYAESGTLLGTIRHGGFIPWDDDLDIVMIRPDYIRFLNVVKDELPKDYLVLNIYDEDGYDNYLTRIVNSGGINRSSQFLEDNYGCPYSIGIDVFVMDYIPEDRELLADQRNDFMRLNNFIQGDTLTKEESIEAKKLVDTLKKKYSADIPESRILRSQIFLLQDHILAYYNERSHQIGLSPFWITLDAQIYDISYFDKPILMDFEMVKIPVPPFYDSILTKKYGSYSSLVRQGGMHGYPFFESQVELVEENWGKSEYCFFNTDPLKINTSKRKDINVAKERERLYKPFLDNLENAYNALFSVINEGNINLALDILQKCQELAITLGTSIENIYGDNHNSVHVIEKYCEAVYSFYECIENNMADDLNEKYSCLADATNAVSISIDADIINKRYVIFLPYEYNEFASINHIYNGELIKKNTEVYVIPVPFYERNNARDGLSDVKTNGWQFKDVEITDYKKVNLGKMYPDVIIYQSVFDEYNETFLVDRNYQSENLLKCAKEVICIPDMYISDFDSSDYRAYKNFKHFAVTKGVVNADKVVLPSEKVKNIYLSLYKDWAGNDFAKYIEDKIVISPYDIAERNQKILLYYVSPSSIIAYGDRAISKIESCLKIFMDNSDKLKIVWCINETFNAYLRDNMPHVYDKYDKIIENCDRSKISIVNIESSKEAQNIANTATAFYGDGGLIATKCIIRHIPVMIQNVEV